MYYVGYGITTEQSTLRSGGQVTKKRCVRRSDTSSSLDLEAVHDQNTAGKGSRTSLSVPQILYQTFHSIYSVVTGITDFRNLAGLHVAL